MKKRILSSALILILFLTLFPSERIQAASSSWRKYDYIELGQDIYSAQTGWKLKYKTYKAADLSKEAQAMGFYAYQYFCGGSIGYKDSRIKNGDEYGCEHKITRSNIKQVLKEMFGSAKATAKVIKLYSDGKKGKYYMFGAEGDFGGVPDQRFDSEHVKMKTKGKYIVITGKVKAYSFKKQKVIDKGTYTLKYRKKTSANGIHKLVSIKVSKLHRKEIRLHKKG